MFLSQTTSYESAPVIKKKESRKRLTGTSIMFNPNQVGGIEANVFSNFYVLLFN